MEKLEQVSGAALPGLFLPVVQGWFTERLGAPTGAQVRAWPAIAAGEHVLLAAPTGSGKTLAAFLQALDGLLRQGESLEERTQVLYVSPLRALSNDVQKNLAGPLAELRERDPSLPEVHVLVRTGDTPSHERTRMVKRPPHVLVTTPESLGILLTSEGGRSILGDVRTVIVDEIHAIVGSKRGTHLALSLERLEWITGSPIQRIGLSATQKPLIDVANFLVGPERSCTLIDEGHRRELDLSVAMPPAELGQVCSHEQWQDIHESIAALVREHTSTLVFANTRKVCERTAAELARILGPERVTSHHSSLSKDRRLEAERRLKDGDLDCLVATASLELGIDIGDVDLVVQVGTTRSIAALLQRVGRSGHGVGRVPKGVVYPVAQDELVEAAGLMLAIRRGDLDRTPQPAAPLDILAQAIVGACVPEDLDVGHLLVRLRRAWPFRDLARERLDDVIALHTGKQHSLLHYDQATDRLRATRRARLISITSSGAIPDKADYRVVAEPEGLTVGTVDEDFAVEVNGGDVFQLGNMAWRVLRAEPGVLRVIDAPGAQPSMPFWLGEAPTRTAELCAAMGEVRELGREADWLEAECGLDADVAAFLSEELRASADALGSVPTPKRIVIERFPDESGGTQLVLHSLFGGRVNRAFGLALRKRFCRSFGFELQAAAGEDAVLISLGPMHSFPLDEVFDYLRPDTVKDMLMQAVLDAPVFQTRWRWNVSRALLAPRAPGGKRLPPPIQRMRADDLLVEAFPDVVACGETLAAGDIDIPVGHPMVDQTLDDCLYENMDLDGLVDLLQGLQDGTIERATIETAEPSPLAQGALAIGPYGFLDDAPLEERRSQAVRGGWRSEAATEIGILAPEAIERARIEAWPDPRSADEVHEVLTWMGYVETPEVAGAADTLDWRPWLAELAAAGRVVQEGERWYAAETGRDPLDLARGRLEVLVPVPAAHEDTLLQALEAEGLAVRIELQGRPCWIHRRLLARIQRYTREDKRRRIRPVATAAFRSFLSSWHGMDGKGRFDGPAGLFEVVQRLAGWEAPAPLWEAELLPARVPGYRREWLDQLCMSGQVAWGRLWGSAKPAVKSTPLTLFPRAELALWEAWAGPAPEEDLAWPARRVLDALRERGPLFQTDLEGVPGLLPSDGERGLDELIARGFITSDSFAALRPLLIAPSKRRPSPFAPAGRWSLFRTRDAAAPDPEEAARLLLRRYGVIFRTLLERERLPMFWRDMHRALRLMELRGEVHGGRFVQGYAGEQFALPSAIASLRAAEEATAWTPTSAADPLALDGVLVPGRRMGSPAS